MTAVVPWSRQRVLLPADRVPDLAPGVLSIERIDQADDAIDEIQDAMERWIKARFPEATSLSIEAELSARTGGIVFTIGGRLPDLGRALPAGGPVVALPAQHRRIGHAP